MLCSAPPPSKSGSNWLDRLRSNKGFPTATADEEDNKSLGLDHFLQNQDPIESTRSNPSSTQSNHEPVANRTHENGHKKEQLYSLMSNVLSELFFMDDDNHFQSSKISGKKFPRKQTAPKSLTTSTNSNVHLPRQEEEEEEGEEEEEEEEEEEKSLARAERNAGPTASFNSDNSMKQTKVGNVEEEEAEVGEDEEKEEVRELVGYSRSEVTVIDTSFGVWKSEKVVYRRKNVWKVREKRGKVKSLGRKKRKGKGGCNDGNGGDENVVGAMKKAKVSCSESAAALNQCLMQGQSSPQNDTREEVSKDTPDDLTQVPKKRFHFSRSPRKSRKGGSSVILIKGIPTGKKHEEKLLRKCHKDA